jgi:cysteine dioxygenase
MSINHLANNIQNILDDNNNNFEDHKISNILNNFDFSNFDFPKLNLNKNSVYTKFKLYNNEYFEIYIIYWYPNKKSKIHDHSINGCWLKVLNGNLEENIYDLELNLIKTNKLNKNDISFMKDDKIGYHSISNISDNITTTIHVYSPINHITSYF